MRSKEDTDNSRRVFQSASTSGRYKYDMMPRCPDCGIHMKYIYGEMFECPVCHRQEQTQFGKVRSYLEEHGPPAGFYDFRQDLFAEIFSVRAEGIQSSHTR